MKQQTRALEILLVEAQSLSHTIVRQVLAQLGVTFHLHVVTNEGQALAFLQHDAPYTQAPRPDVILLALDQARSKAFSATLRQDARFAPISRIVLSPSADTDEESPDTQTIVPVDVSAVSPTNYYLYTLKVIEKFWLSAAALFQSSEEAEGPQDMATTQTNGPSSLVEPADPSATITMWKPWRRGSGPLLIVEDSDEDFETALRALGQRLPLAVERCASGSAAMDYLFRRGTWSHAVQPSLVLLDLNLPGLHGYDVLARMKAEPSLCMIPVVIVSTSNNPDEVYRCYAAGAAGYIVKTLSYVQFAQTMQVMKQYWLETVVLPNTGLPIPQPL